MEHILTSLILVIIITLYISSKQIFLEKIRLSIKKNKQLKAENTKLQKRIYGLRVELSKFKKMKQNNSIPKKNDLGDYLKKKRIEKRVSKKTLAKLCERSVSYISMIENNKIIDETIPRDLVVNIGKKLEVSPTQLKKIKSKYKVYITSKIQN